MYNKNPLSTFFQEILFFIGINVKTKMSGMACLYITSMYNKNNNLNLEYKRLCNCYTFECNFLTS